MAKGIDTGGHPGRQVGPHLSQHWRPKDSITGPMGAAFAALDRPDSNMEITAWQGPGGHHAEVEQDVNASVGFTRGVEHNRYVAGPFRTPLRAQIAGESLANRVESGAGTEQYQHDSWTEYRGRYV